MQITQKLSEFDPTLVLHNEGAWDKPYDPLSNGFSSYNDAGLEVETGEFLYAILRLLKPEHVLETGTHVGVGAAYMGQALKDNNKGFLDTLEFLPELAKRAQERMRQLQLDFQVTVHLTDAAKFEPGVKYGFILLDTEPQTRFAEYIKYYDYLEDGGYLFIHDLHRHMHQIENLEHGFAWPYGEVPAFMKETVRHGKMRPMHFPTPRGLTGFYKTRPDDYKWQIITNS